MAEDTNANNETNKKLYFKNIDPFRPCISKIKSALIDKDEDLDIVMLMYNLLDYVTVILWHKEVYGIIIEMK